MNDEPILITGVGQRLGFQLALNFLQRGTPVIGTFRTQRPGVDELRTRKAELYQCDFTDQSQLISFIEAVKARHGRLRAIIHNASAWLPDGTTAEAAAAVMNQMMLVHVYAPYQLNLGLSPLLEASQALHADIVHIGDYVSSRGSKKHIAYAASKAAQDNLTLSFAARLAPKVKVNSIAPALMMFNEHDDDAYRHKARDKSLMQREGGVEEFLHSIDYVLNSSYVTGRVLHLDGGRHLK